MSVRAPVTKQSDEWETPGWLFRALDAEFGFTLDAAATKENAKCVVYFTEDMNGLNAVWGRASKVFVNPPYSALGPWVEKCLDEPTTLVVMLLPVRTDNSWFPYLLHNPRVQLRFFRKRIAFLENGVETKSPPFASMVAVIR